MKTYLHYFIVVVLVCAATYANAQNLVVNPSFEITTSNCANFGGEGFFTDLGGSWDNANSAPGGDTCTSPDLFSLCNILPPNVGINAPTNMPSSPLGYQYSRTGTRHAGFILHEQGDEYREYIQGRTTSPLVAGKTYEVSMYINLASEMPFATNNIGVRFSNAHYLRDACQGGNGANTSGIYLTPQLNYTDTAITDTTNWVQLKWNYVATGGEQYFIIGNFFNNANTLIVNTGKSVLPNPFAYYYIDDVSIEAVYHCSDSIAFSNVLQPGCGTGNGTLSAAVITLPTDTFAYNYIWNTGDTIKHLSALGAGTYTVTATNSAGCSISKSYVLNNVFADSVSLITADATCGQNNGSITVSLSSSLLPVYLWSNNAGTTQTISNLAKGSYSVTVTFPNGCIVVDSTIVGRPVINVTASTNGICAGDSVQVCAPNGYTSYLWNNGATTRCISVNRSGDYHVSVTDNTACTEVSEDIRIDTLLSSPVTAVLSGNQVVAVGNGAQSFQWYSDNGLVSSATTQSYAPSQPGNYWVEVTNSNGCKSQSNTVNFGNCNAQYFLIQDSLTVHVWFALIVSTGTFPLTYTWNWGDGTTTTGFTPHTYSTPGNYNICLTITDATGCSDMYCDSSTYVQKIESDPITVNPVLQLPTGIKEAAPALQLSVYPNPANNKLFIQSGDVQVNTVNICNVTGSLVKTVSQLNTGEGIDVSQLPAGVYVADVHTKQGNVRKRWLKM